MSFSWLANFVVSLASAAAARGSGKRVSALLAIRLSTWDSYSTRMVTACILFSIASECRVRGLCVCVCVQDLLLRLAVL